MKSTFLYLFDLHHDQAEHHVIEKTVRQGVRIGGTNLWVLIFAILIASIGLNVNSTAVIIGAMLISPLMGPIIAVGYGAATNDADLIRAALRNLVMFVVISLLASFLYFKISPLSQAHSELLARTTPTLWDVLIAFFGGAAGIVALTRRQASPVIPGVAIATALMPPLCTAGYGLANGNLAYFGGAFYLFVINSVFIALATALFVNLMRLPQHSHATASMQRKTRIWVSVLLVAMIVPSTWLAYQLVREELFNKAVAGVLARTDIGPGVFELSRQINAKQRKLVITLGGDTPPDGLQNSISGALRTAGFEGVEIEVRYLGAANLAKQLNQGLEGLYAKAVDQLARTDQALQALSTENQRLKSLMSERKGLEMEILTLNPSVESVVVAEGQRVRLQSPAETDERTVVVTLFLRNGGLSAAESQRMRAWLKARIPGRDVALVQARALGLTDAKEIPKL